MMSSSSQAAIVGRYSTLPFSPNSGPGGVLRHRGWTVQRQGQLAASPRLGGSSG